MAKDKEQAIVEIILKGQQANASIKEMDRAVSALRSQINKLPKDSQEFAEKSKEFKQISSRVKAVKEEVFGLGNAFKGASANQGGLFSSLKTGIASVFGGNLLTSAAGKIKSIWTDAIQTQREFEKSLKNLSAITGASGADLEYYKNQALDMGLKVEGGAKSVVEAFKFIASAKPELLENKEALAEVTRQAILLSQAAGLDLPDASQRLTDAMNQFGAPAQEAAKYVDALAAGAKYGAAEVPEVTDALLKFGVAAKSSNINIYESVAAVELLGEKGLKGAEAGTQLRNIFAKLSAASILPKEALESLNAAGVNISVLSDKTQPLSVRLKELSKIQGDAATITRVFGLESKNAGEALISNLGRLEKLTEQVQETGSATEQAAKNLDTLEQAEIEAKNEWDNMMLSFTSGDFGEVIKGFVKKATEGLRELKISIGAIGTLLRSGSFSDAAETMTKGNIAEIQKKVISQMTEEKRKAVLAQEKMEVEAMIRTLQKTKGVTKEQQEDYAKNIGYKIALIKELQKYNATSLAQQATDEKTTMDQVVQIDKEAVDKRKKLLEDLTRIALGQDMDKMSEDEREIAQVVHKYEELRKRANGNKQDLKQIEVLYGNEIAALMEKQMERKAELWDKENKEAKAKSDELKQFQTSTQKQINDVFLTEEARAIQDINDKWNEKIRIAQEKGVELKGVEEARLKELQEVYKKFHKDELLEDLLFNGEKKATAMDFYNAVENFAGALNTKKKIADDQELKQLEDKYDTERKKTKQLYDNKRITKDEFDKRMAAIDAKQRAQQKAIRDKAAEREKQAAVRGAIISGIQGVAKTLGEYSYPFNLVLAALHAAAASIQVQNLEAAETPTYAVGGLHTSSKPSGFVNKPTLFSNSASGQNFIAGEAGAEWIAPYWMLQNPVTANAIGTLEGIRQRGFASGGLTDENSTISKGSGNPAVQFMQGNNGELVAVISGLKQVLEKGITAHLSYDDFTKTQNFIDSARTSAQVKNG